MAKPAASRSASRATPDQKERLIAATEKLLASQGLGCVSTRDIAKEANVAEGALYHHFGDKAELILSVVLQQLGDFPEVLQSLPLRIGENTVQKNLETVLESAFAFHHRIAPLVCSLFADQELLARVRGIMVERSMGPARSVFAISAYLRAEQQLGRVSASAVPETIAEVMLAVSFNRAMQDHFFLGASEGEAKAKRKLREAVRALMVGLDPGENDARTVAKGARR
ncbi:MAG TPA: helix-turn-helix domain-containing protein [Burkholderiales bacterium]|nr:helix-turn-helix domain-containing protein [Burkholderiales bacterium]HYA46186.1 helix-turn-helix domain-containing protein [Burkholderiales bacterium]